MSNFKTLAEYFSDGRPFVVPYYQRGYKWSLQKNEKRGDLHLRLLLSDLKREFASSVRDGKIIPNYEYYLQGITAKETADEIELVDGQQRTTSVFVLFSLFKARNLKLDIKLDGKLRYNVREAGNRVLQGFVDGVCEGDETIQDVAALRKAWRMCDEELRDVKDLDLFAEFVLHHVKIIYIKLDSNQDETKVFSMMNQDKAEMSQTDLVKSNLLREASRQVYSDITQLQGQVDGLEWQINQMRTKHAVQWDNWRKWWEDEDHWKFAQMIAFPSKTVMEPRLIVLLKLYQRYCSDEKKINESALFEYFKNRIVADSYAGVRAIEVFDKLHLLQNVVQEWYDNHSIYNYMGLLFKGCKLEKKEEKVIELISRYIDNKAKFADVLKKEYILAVLDGEKKETVLKTLLEEKDVYHVLYTPVARHLLRMNVSRAEKQKQKFEFRLYIEDNFNRGEIDDKSTRSLEHIKPQTYINPKLSEAELNEVNALTNTIGNLVLIPKGLNSKLSNRSFNEKKEIVFTEVVDTGSRDQGLWLHTLSVFGKPTDWLVSEINNNRVLFEREFTSFFK